MKRLVTLLLLVISFSASVTAQRTTDLQVIMTAPDDSEYIPPMQNFAITVHVKNVGTTNVELTDTLAYYLLVDGDSLLFFPQNENHLDFTQNLLEPGDSVTFTRFMIFDESFEGQTIELCVFVKPRNLTDPINDSQIFNNKDCAIIFIMEDVTGIADQEGDAVTLFPNPASGQFTIKSQLPVSAMSATDASGKALRLGTVGSQTIDCSSWAPGTYFLTIETEKGSVVKRLIVR